MKTLLITILLVGLSLITACSLKHDRLLFIEQAHIGLIARVSPDETAPADIDFGYRRSILTLTPQINADTTEPGGGYPPDKDFGEVMSVVSSFSGKVAWFDTTEVHTYFATGEAAKNTARSPDAIKALRETTTKPAN